MRFQTKLMLGITALSFGTTAFFSVLFLNLARGLAAERLEEKALSLARNLASNSSQAVYNEDLYKQLGPLLKGLLETPDVVAACVRDASGRVLARAGADLPAAAEAGWSEGARGRVFTAAAPVRSRGAGLTPNDSSIGSVPLRVARSSRAPWPFKIVNRAFEIFAARSKSRIPSDSPMSQ